MLCSTEHFRLSLKKDSGVGSTEGGWASSVSGSSKS